MISSNKLLVLGRFLRSVVCLPVAGSQDDAYLFQ